MQLLEDREEVAEMPQLHCGEVVVNHFARAFAEARGQRNDTSSGTRDEVVRIGPRCQAAHMHTVEMRVPIPLSARSRDPSNTFVSTFDTGERLSGKSTHKRLVRVGTAARLGQNDDAHRLERPIARRRRPPDASTMATNNIGRPARTCILVDSDSGLLDSLTAQLVEAGCTVVALAGSGADGVRLIDLHQPDAAVIDSQLGDMTGIDLAQQAAAVAPLTALVLHADDLPKSAQDAAFAAGFSAIVVKAAGSPHLAEAVGTACAGDVYLDPALRD
jgi:CheY-like chemotaxis protein